jgi:hypothetical protein
MPALEIALLVLGVVLLVAALAGGRILGQAMTGPARVTVRVLVAVLGLAVLAAALAPAVLPGFQWQALLGRAAPPQAAASEAAKDRQLAVDLVAAASTALINCPEADPPVLPDAANATRAQMDDARRAFEAYDASTSAYTKCVDATVDRIARERAGMVPPEAITRLQDFGTRAHNVAIDKEQTFANEFNQQVRDFNAKHPK